MGVGMMMRNKAEELALLNPFVITFQICEIKEGQLHDFYDTLDEEADFCEFANPHDRQRSGRQ